MNTNGEMLPFMDNERQLIKSNRLSKAQNSVAFQDDFISMSILIWNFWLGRSYFPVEQHISWFLKSTFKFYLACFYRKQAQILKPWGYPALSVWLCHLNFQYYSAVWGIQIISYVYKVENLKKGCHWTQLLIIKSIWECIWKTKEVAILDHDLWDAHRSSQELFQWGVCQASDWNGAS